MMIPYKHLNMYKDKIEKIIKELLYMDFIHPISSPFSSSIMSMKKKDGIIWMYIDYRLLNKKKIKNRYPIPQVDDLVDELHGVKYFFKIDLKTKYH